MFAVFGELDTKFTNATFGFYFILLGMPAFLAAWFCFLIFATFRPVRSEWLVGAVAAALLIVIGYANIGHRFL